MKPFSSSNHEWAVFTGTIAFAETVEHAEKTGDGMLASRYTPHGTWCSSAQVDA
jgi:hypothetical protein